MSRVYSWRAGAWWKPHKVSETRLGVPHVIWRLVHDASSTRRKLPVSIAIMDPVQVAIDAV